MLVSVVVGPSLGQSAVDDGVAGDAAHFVFEQPKIDVVQRKRQRHAQPAHAGRDFDRRSGQRRIYTPRDRTRLKLTLRGKRLGLTLSEIREIVDMYDSGGDERPQLEKFLAVLEAHKRQLEQQREDIDAQLSEIELFEKRCRNLLSKHLRIERAPKRRRA